MGKCGARSRCDELCSGRLSRYVFCHADATTVSWTVALTVSAGVRPVVAAGSPEGLRYEAAAQRSAGPRVRFDTTKPFVAQAFRPAKRPRAALKGCATLILKGLLSPAVVAGSREARTTGTLNADKWGNKRSSGRPA